MAQIIKLHFDSSDPLPGAPLAGLAESIRMPKSLDSLVRPRTLEKISDAARSSLAGQHDELAARRYLDGILSERAGELFGLTAPNEPSIVPDLRLVDVQDLDLVPTRVVRFVQTCKSIPVFGSAAVIEIDRVDRRLVTADATLTDKPDVSALASLGPTQALSAIESMAGQVLSESARDSVEPPEINFYCDTQGGRWHLVFYFKKVPLLPPGQRDPATAGIATSHLGGHGLGRSPRDDFPAFDYLVNAHDGSVVYWFSSQPQLDVPCPCTGIDEWGQRQDFYGFQVGSHFQLTDPIRDIQTYDHAGNDLTAAALPATPISHTTNDFARTSTAGVSAHYYMMLVFDFFNHVLKRKGIDNKGMALISMVNVTYSRHEPAPEWHNAVWWNNRMWYGQARDGNGRFESFARYFDVIAHELCHGVTETTANLVYRDQSGALNESFSDIFGIMVRNWYPGQPNPVSSWDWKLGTGLGTHGGPLRDLEDPTRCGQPDHMNKYLVTHRDNGGVHANSGIHNKAAYNLLTARDASGGFVFSANEVAILYYLTLTRLTRLSGFSDTLRVLTSVVGTYFAGNVSIQQARKQVVQNAYNAVGIH